MSILPNARVAVRRNGVSLGTTYTNRVVQIDDDKAERDANMGGLPVVGKMLYDRPSSTYRRGDRVDILAMAGHGRLVPEDHIYWVRRANLSGAPLAATEVGLVGGIPTNSTLAVYRETTLVIPALRAYYVLSGPERFVAGEGNTLAGTLFVPDTTMDIELNDILVFTEGDDLKDLDQQRQYQVSSALHAPAPVPHIRVDLNTVIGSFAGGVPAGN